LFFKVVEFLLRLLYYKRFRAADRIGRAAQLLTSARAPEALALLQRLRPSLHSSLLPLYCFTLGRTFTVLGRPAAAETAFLQAAGGDSKSARAEVEIALLRAREGDHLSCQTWLRKAIDKKDDVHSPRAAAFLQQLSRVEDGSLRTEFETRAETIAHATLPGADDCPGLPPDCALLERWARQNPQSAQELFDEIALLLAWSRVRQGGTWVLRLAIEDTRVQLPDGSIHDPFKEAALLLHFTDAENALPS
jgi:hypothetical protein